VTKKIHSSRKNRSA